MSPRAAAEEQIVDARPGSRSRLLDAGRALVESDGVAALTVGSICDRAQLSRATFYVHFSNRDAVLLTLFLEEAAAVIGASSALATEYPQFGELCVEAFVQGVDRIRANSMLRILFADEGASVTARLASTSQAFLAMAHEFWEPLVVAAQARGEVRAGLEADAVVGWLIRVFMSYLEEPEASSTPSDVRRREIQTFLLPAFLARQETNAGTGDLEAEHLLDQLAVQNDLIRSKLDALREHLGT